MYEYKAIVTNVVDGDTVDVDIDLGFGVWIRDERIRLMGIDTAETRTSNATEKSWGIAAKDLVTSLTGSNKSVIIKTEKDKSGKYGRILGTIELVLDGKTVNLNELLVEEKLAVPYLGGNRDDNREAFGIWEYWSIDYDEYLAQKALQESGE